jgi:ABC-type glycerol-3-phosphate transport system substrate-binding protein
VKVYNVAPQRKAGGRMKKVGALLLLLVLLAFSAGCIGSNGTGSTTSSTRGDHNLNALEAGLRRR